jgi:hypothetical protein
MIGWSRCFNGDTGGYLVAFGVSLAKSYGWHLMSLAKSYHLQK